MAYRLKTFRVQFVAEAADFPVGSPCRSSDDVQRVARGIYQTRDADQEHFQLLTMNNKNRVAAGYRNGGNRKGDQRRGSQTADAGRTARAMTKPSAPLFNFLSLDGRG